MPTINNPNLTLTPSGLGEEDNVAVNVRYNVVFSPLERHLAANGLVFRERISVLEVDLGGTTSLFTFLPIENILGMTAGTTPQTITRNRTMNVLRGDLINDVRVLGSEIISLGDEIRCRIEITPIGLPVPTSALTDEERLRPVPGTL